MSSMLFLAVIIVLVSGLIAYIGDLVGRKMGRKRLSLMGLRPKYTAIIISVGVGMLIAATTLTATLIVNAGVRRAFFTPISQLQADLASAQQQVKLTKGELVRSSRRFETISTELQGTTHKLDTAESQLKNSQQRLTGKQRQLARVQRSLAGIQARLTAKQTELSRNRRQLTLVAEKLKDAQADYQRVHSELSASRARLDETQDKLTQTEAKMVQATRNLLREQEELIGKREQLAAEVNKLNEQVQILRQFAMGSFAPLSFASGQEIISGVTATKSSPESRNTWLRDFLAIAERIVRQRNAELPVSASALIFLSGCEPPSRISTEEAVNLLSEKIAGLAALDSEAIVRLAPANNVTVNGQAIILVDAVDVIPNYLTYATGNEVAHLDLTVNERTTTAEVVGKLVDDLLMTGVPSALRKEKMVMLTRRFDPAHPQALPETSMPVVPWAELLKAAEQVKTCQGKVRVIARTEAPTRRAGPLDFSLDVIALPTP